MEVGVASQTPPAALGSTTANGWIYSLFEVAVVIGLVCLVTLPFWGRRLFRPFGVKGEDPD